MYGISVQSTLDVFTVALLASLKHCMHVTIISHIHHMQYEQGQPFTALLDLSVHSAVKWARLHYPAVVALRILSQQRQQSNFRTPST